LAAWASAAGFGLVAWGLGTEAPTQAEAKKNIEQQKDLLRERGIEVPATAGTQTPTARQPWWNALDAVKLVFGVRSGLRHPRRLTVLAIASEAPLAVFYVLRVPRAAQRRRPRIAAGSAVVVAGAVARLRAASAEPPPVTAGLRSTRIRVSHRGRHNLKGIWNYANTQREGNMK
jgi:hypothetical protein